MKSSRLLTGSLLGSVLACAILLPSAIAQTDDQATPENSSASASTVIDVSGAGTNPQQGTIVKGIDAAGDVAGTYIDSLGAYHGFTRAANGTFTVINAGGTDSAGKGNIVTIMDSAGDVAGYTTDGRNYDDVFFTVTPSGTVSPDIFSGNAFSINTNGSVTGYQYNNSAAFLYLTGAAPTTFNVPPPSGQFYPTVGIAINTAGVITGNYLAGNYPSMVSHGFVRAANGTITTFDPANVAISPTTSILSDSGTTPTSIDTAGDIAGTYTDTTGARHSFVRLANGNITSFDPPGTDTSPCAATGMGNVLCGSGALGMDDAGDIVGVYFDTDGVAHGYLRSGSTGAFTTVTLSEAGTSAFQGTAIFAVNASGTVAGTYVDTNSVLHGFTYVVGLDTTTALTPSQSATIYGEPATFTAVVTSASGAPPDGESVVFMNGSTQLGSATLSGGTASYTTTALPVGGDSVTAVYSGDSTLAGSSSTAAAQAVSKASSTTALSSSLNPSGVGESVNLTATISGEFGGTATGTVTFSNGSTSLGSASLSGNQAVLTTTALPQGTDSITAVYGGDANFTGSTSSALSQVVNAAATPDFTLSLNPTSLTVTGGQSGTSTITVTNEGGFNSTVGFVCTGLPAGATCSFTTQTVPTPSGVTYSTMTVNTTTADAALHGNARPLLPGSVLPGSALAVALCCFGFRKRRRLQMFLLLAVSAVGLTLFTGCGSGSAGGGTQSPNYTVTVTATSGALSHTANLSLTVD